MKKVIFWIVVVVVFLLALLAGSMVRINAYEVGVRTDNFGMGGRGVVAHDFGPGWHLRIPFMQKWNTFPAHIRRVEMTKDSRQRSALGTDALVVQSSDGDRVILDFNVFYRVKPGSAHRLLQDSGPGDGHVGVLKTIVSDRLRAVLGNLRTEQFYDADARQKMTLKALEAMREPLASRFLEVLDVQIQDVEFEPKYEQKIKEKKLADQRVELNKAQARAATERAKVAAIEIETTKEVKLIETRAEADAAKIKAEAEKYAAEKRSGADLYAEELRAKGNLAVARSEAKVKHAKSSALSGSGGANLAALEAVRNLKLDTISFPTGGRDWFDVHEMAIRLGARR